MPVALWYTASHTGIFLQQPNALRLRLRKISVIFANTSLIESEKERNLCTKFFGVSGFECVSDP